MFLYGERGENKPVNFFPCFICKKMIINAGLKRVVSSLENGEYKVFKVKDWVRQWQEKDMLDDQDKYGEDQNKD
jgi:dCMP deaminase